jgi:hypothetical protein
MKNPHTRWDRVIPRTELSYPSNALKVTKLHSCVPSTAENTILKLLNTLTVAIFKSIPSSSVMIAPAASERLRAILVYLGGVL